MAKQVMTLREEPIVIATAHGVIEIHRLPSGRSRSGRPERKLDIRLPKGLRARVGNEIATRENPWVTVAGDDVRPKHPVLESATDGGGRLIELRPPRPLRVTRTA